MAGGTNKYIFGNSRQEYDNQPIIKNVQIGIVALVDDPNSLGRIKVAIKGPANKGGDDGTSINDLPWCYPMVPRFFASPPKIGEAVFILLFNEQKSFSDRLYFGPIISQYDKLNFDSINSTALNSFTFALTNPSSNYSTIPALNGVFPKDDDIAIQGRYNTDVILRRNEILIRAGKFVESTPTDTNPFNFTFNNTNQGYFHIRNNVFIEPPNNTNTPRKSGSVVNVVGSKINLLTHDNGTPKFNLMNQDDQISDEELLNIIQTAHPLPFGDVLVKYLRLLKNALLTHVHNNNGLPPTDLTVGTAQNISIFKKSADDLENKMLSKNININ